MEISLRLVFIAVVITSILANLMLLVSMSHKIGNSRTYLSIKESFLHGLTSHKIGLDTNNTVHHLVYNRSNVDQLSPHEQKAKMDIKFLPSEHTLSTNRSLPQSSIPNVNDTLVGLQYKQTHNAMFINRTQTDKKRYLGNYIIDKNGNSSLLKVPLDRNTTKVTTSSTNPPVNCSSRYQMTTPPKRLFPDQPIIFMDGVGRLGNKMFQYAALLGIAKWNGFTPLAHSRSLIVPVFEISHVTNVKYSNLPVFLEGAAAQYEPCVETMRRDTDWRLGGYYQSWKYFQHIEQDIRKEFIFKQHVQVKVNKTLADLPAEFKGRPKVGVHSRRGDMSVKSSIKKGYTVAPKEYFLRAMEYFRARLKNPVFIVISDDINWIRRNLGTEKDVVIRHGNKETDLCTLASCDHSIVSTGTYGWWGAWLAGGITVYYKSFPKNGSWLETQYNHQDYFPPSWIDEITVIGEAVEDIRDTRRNCRSYVADINNSKKKKMDVMINAYPIDLAAAPILHEVIDATVDGTNWCNVRDAVVMNISDMKVTVFADYSREQLKSVHQRGNKKSSSILQVSGLPWCIAVIGEKDLAVSVNEKHIIIVSVTPELELLSTIPTSKTYSGLCTLDQSTLVAGSESPPSVDLIDMQGNVLKTFTTLPTIGKSFRSPHYIHVTRQGTILVSDSELESVICLTQSGDIVFTYTPTGEALQHPYGITTTSTGDILVAHYSAHKVIHLSSSGHFIRDILTVEDGLDKPFGLCLDEDKLCVTIEATGLHKYKFGTQ